VAVQQEVQSRLFDALAGFEDIPWNRDEEGSG